MLHHSFFYEPPYFPGYRDVWGHVAVARAAAHPWGAQRLLGYVILSGLFDQFPNLRIGFAECSGGWLPSWLVRLEGQADYLHPSLPTRSSARRSSYAEDGRIFCGVELYEGEETVRSIIEMIGDDAIMYQSDYPHDQCAFPKSPDAVLGVAVRRGERRDADQAVLRQRRALPPAPVTTGVALPLVAGDTADPELAAVFDVFRDAGRDVPTAVPHARQLAGDAQRLGGAGLAAAQRGGVTARAARADHHARRPAHRRTVTSGSPTGTWRSSAGSSDEQLDGARTGGARATCFSTDEQRACWR